MINTIKNQIKKLEKDLSKYKKNLISSLVKIIIIVMVLLFFDGILIRSILMVLLFIYFGVTFYFTKMLFDTNSEISYNKRLLIQYEQDELRKKFDRLFNSYKRSYDSNSYYGKTKTININQNIQSSFTLMGLSIKDTEQKIKSRYRELVKEWHPDLFTNDTIQNQEIANRNMQKVNKAYNIIKTYKNIK